MSAGVCGNAQRPDQPHLEYDMGCDLLVLLESLALVLTFKAAILACVLLDWRGHDGHTRGRSHGRLTAKERPGSA